MPYQLQACILQSLKESPQCCISLTDLLDGNGKIVSGTVALLQRSESSAGNGEYVYHAHLFCKDSLDQWFRTSQSQMNPMTRCEVDKKTQYVQLS
jgi:hypothetical protein